MAMLLGIWCMTTAIAIAFALSAARASLQRRMLPWAGGVLLGIALFWVLPELAVDRGWLRSLTGVMAILLLLALVDRYIYPICPFCAAGVHTHEASRNPRVISLGWPLLVVGCLHSLFDGWIIGFSQAAASSNAAAALAWGATIHKIPESAAIGFLAARLTSRRNTALGTVALIQAAMGLGMVLAVFAGAVNSDWADLCSMPACAFLLLFGLLALQQEWRLHGGVSAMGTVAPGLAGCGLFALATWILRR
jgi:zinc transporter ZupT